MSVTAFARLAGLSRPVIAYLEADQYGPREKTARLIAEATGVDPAKVCRLAEIRAPADWACHRLTEAALRRAYLDERRPLRQLAAEIGVSQKTLVDHLRAQDLPVRRRGELRRRYQLVDAQPFAEPETDWHAYWLGFLAADGCVFTADGRFLVRLRLKASDEDHVRNFADGTGSDALVKVAKDGYVQVEYHGRALVAALARWGIVPNKTLTIGFPDDFPSRLQPAFVRGYFDGDGSIYWRRRGGGRAVSCKFVSGSPPMIDGLREILTRAGIATGKICPGSGRAVVLPVLTARVNLRRFAEYLYADATVWLPRKRTIFDQLIVRI
jgi:DNA-binding XRE family transcriptional regulator